jgi:hypothetical protein
LRETLASSPTDVRSEADLITPNPDIVDKLLAELGPVAPAGVKGNTPQEVAQLVHTLRQHRAENEPIRAPRRRHQVS